MEHVVVSIVPPHFCEQNPFVAPMNDRQVKPIGHMGFAVSHTVPSAEPPMTGGASIMPMTGGASIVPRRVPVSGRLVPESLEVTVLLPASPDATANRVAAEARAAKSLALGIGGPFGLPDFTDLPNSLANAHRLTVGESDIFWRGSRRPGG